MSLHWIDRGVPTCRDCGAQPDFSNPPLSFTGVWVVEIESAASLVDYLICVCDQCVTFYRQSPDCHVAPLLSYTVVDSMRVSDLGFERARVSWYEDTIGNSSNIKRLIHTVAKLRPCPPPAAPRLRTETPRPARMRRPIPYGLRYSVLERDGFRCKTCGRTPEQHGVVLHVDHIVAVVKGGTNDPGNLRALCAECNLGKSDR